MILATSQDFDHDTLYLGGISSGNGSMSGKGADGNDGSKHTGDTDLFDEEDKEEDDQEKELPLQVILPGTTFESRTDAVDSVKEFSKKHYQPLVLLRVIVIET